MRKCFGGRGRCVQQFTYPVEDLRFSGYQWNGVTYQESVLQTFA